MKNSQFDELTRDYFAIGSVTNNVYYMGQEQAPRDAMDRLEILSVDERVNHARWWHFREVRSY